MSEFTDSYVNLLIKQYWEQPNARAEIEAGAAAWEPIRDTIAAIPDQFDVDQAFGRGLDILGAIVGVPRAVPNGVPRTFFGFAGNLNTLGFGQAPFADKFDTGRVSFELDDFQYRRFILAKIAVNTGSAYLVSDDRTSLQDAIQLLFGGAAYVTDNQNMTLNLWVDPQYNLDLLSAIRALDLLPAPQGVGYAIIVQSAPGETFGFAGNPDSLGWDDKFDPNPNPGIFAQKVLT